MPRTQTDFFLFLGLLSLFIVPFLFFNSSEAPAKPSPIPPLAPCTVATMYSQTPVILPLLGRGSHLITSHITSSVSDIGKIKCGLLHLFLQHTSCALTMNENWDEDVRKDMSDSLDKLAPEDKKGQGLYRHDAEGTDDMPVSPQGRYSGCGSDHRKNNGVPCLARWALVTYQALAIFSSPLMHLLIAFVLGSHQICPHRSKR